MTHERDVIPACLLKKSTTEDGIMETGMVQVQDAVAIRDKFNLSVLSWPLSRSKLVCPIFIRVVSRPRAHCNWKVTQYTSIYNLISFVSCSLSFPSYLLIL